MVEFNYKSWPKTKKVRLKKEILLIGQMLFMKGRELTLNTLKSGIFPLKAKKKGEGRPLRKGEGEGSYVTQNINS